MDTFVRDSDLQLMCFYVYKPMYVPNVDEFIYLPSDKYSHTY